MTTARSLPGSNLTLSTGPPLLRRLSKYRAMESWVVLGEMPLTRMLLERGAFSMHTLVESKPRLSPLCFIVVKSKAENMYIGPQVKLLF